MSRWYRRLCPPGTVVTARELLHERLPRAIELALIAGIPRETLAARLDLDDTLAIPATRTTHILRRFLIDRRLGGYEDLPAWEQISLRAEAVELYGPRRPWEALIGPASGFHYDLWLAFWKPLFFSNKCLHKDRPADGAAAFVTQIATRLAVTYLTGRHDENIVDRGRSRDGMRRGTIEWLDRHGFPLTTVYMKAHTGIEDLAHKRAHLESTELARSSYPLVLLDDRPQMVALHARVMRETHGHAFCLSVLVPRNEHEGELPNGALVLPSFGLG